MPPSSSEKVTKKTKVVVFGGCGFLGCSVAEELLERGYQVVVADVNPMPKDLGAVYCRVDICDENAVRNVVEGATYVFNFAAIADIDQAAEMPVAVARVNVLGNVHVLDACRHHDIEKIIYASSVYVNSTTGLFYRTSKLASEKFIEDFGTKFGLNYTILRYGSVYGVGSGSHNIISHYIRQALGEGRIVRRGDAEDLREYIHIRDAAVGAVQALHPRYDGAHLVLAGLSAMRVRDVLEMIREIISRDVEIVYESAASLTHYRTTPYAHNPRMARKLVLDSYYDLGQGLLDMILQEQMALEKKRDVTND